MRVYRLLAWSLKYSVNALTAHTSREKNREEKTIRGFLRMERSREPPAGNIQCFKPNPKGKRHPKGVSFLLEL